MPIFNLLKITIPTGNCGKLQLSNLSWVYYVTFWVCAGTDRQQAVDRWSSQCNNQDTYFWILFCVNFSSIKLDDVSLNVGMHHYGVFSDPATVTLPVWSRLLCTCILVRSLETQLHVYAARRNGCYSYWSAWKHTDLTRQNGESGGGTGLEQISLSDKQNQNFSEHLDTSVYFKSYIYGYLGNTGIFSHQCAAGSVCAYMCSSCGQIQLQYHSCELILPGPQKFQGLFEHLGLVLGSRLPSG